MKKSHPKNPKNTTNPTGDASSVVAQIKKTFSSSAITVTTPTIPTVSTSTISLKETGFARTASTSPASISQRETSLPPADLLVLQFKPFYTLPHGAAEVPDDDNYNNNSGIEHGRECEIGHGNN